MKDGILSYTKTHWKKFGLAKKPSAVHFFVKNKYRKLTFFLFEENEKEPFALAKFTPFPRGREEVIGEYKTLQLIRLKMNNEMKNTIPKPIALINFGAHPVLFMKFHPGKPMDSQINGIFNAWNLDRNLAMVTKWLINFNSCFKYKPKSLSKTEINKFLAEPVYRLIKTDKSMSIKSFSWYFDKLESMKKNQFYLTPKHADLWPGNIIVNKNKVMVLDWENFGLASLPLFDIFHFMVSYFITMNFNSSKNEFEKFYKIFFTSNKYAAYIRKYVEEYCNAFAIDLKHLDLFFIIYLVEFHNLMHKQEGSHYDITIRSNAFIRIFLKNRDNFVFNRFA